MLEFYQLQILKMQKISEQNYCSKYIDEVVRKVPCQKGKRRLVDSIAIYGHYLTDYLILWAVLNIQIKTYSSPIQLSLPLFGLRFLFAVLFIIFKCPVFFMMNKMTIFIQMLLSSDSPVYFSIATAAFELMMCGVWALTKDQRKTHCDSSLNIGITFLKQTLVYSLLGISSIYTRLEWTIERKLSIGIAIFFLLALDYSHFYYHARLRTLFIRLDLTIFALYLLQVLVSLSYVGFVLCSITLLLLTFVEFAITKKLFSELLEGSLSDVDLYGQEELAEHFVSVKLLLQSNDRVMIDAFAHKVRAQTTMKNYHINPENAVGNVQQEELINTYIIINLKNHARKSAFIRDLLIFLYSPDPRVFSSFNLKFWTHRREYERILATRTEMAMLQEFEFEKQKKQSRLLLSKCVDLRQHFYQQLTRQHIKQEKILQLGLQLMKILSSYTNGGRARVKASPQTIFLFHKFSSRCLSPYFEFKIPLIENYQPESSQNNLQFLIGVRFERCMKLLSMNNEFKRMTSYSPPQDRKVSIQSLVGVQLTNYIRNIIQSENRKQQPFRHVQENLELVWIRNALGFLVVGQCSIKSYHCNWDYCLKIRLRPFYSDKAIIVVDSAGKIIGLSELTRYFGFQVDHSGKAIEKHVLKELLQKKEYITKKRESITNLYRVGDVEPYKLTILAHSQPIHGPQQIMILELNCQTHKRVVNDLSEPCQPVPFVFHFNWKGKITNIQIPKQLLSEQNQVERKLDVAYDENITEMRYFNQKIDYKVNFEEEQQCPVLPERSKEQVPDLEEQQFFAKFQLKRQSTGLGLKMVYIIIVLLMLVSLGMLTFMLLTFRGQASRNELYFRTMLKWQYKMHVYTDMTNMPTLWSFDMDLDPMVMIKEAVGVANALASDLFGMMPDLMKSELGQLYQSQVNNFTAQINEYLLNPSEKKAQGVYAISDVFGVTFGNFDGEIVDQWEQQMLAFEQQGTVYIIAPTVLAFTLLFVLSFIHYQLNCSKTDIMKVLKCIDNQDLEEQSRQLQAFRAEWLEKEDSHRDEDHCQHEQQSRSSKRIIQDGSSLIPKPYYLVWLLLITLSLVSLYTSIASFNRTSFHYIDTIETLSVTHHMSKKYWFRMYRKPFSLVSYKILLNKQLSHQNFTQISYHQLIQDPYVNIDDFYYNFWENSTFCSYLSNDDCSTIIGGALKQGGKILFSYLSQSFEELKDLAMKGQDIQSHQNFMTVAKLVYYYLGPMLLANHNAFQKDFQSCTSKYWTWIGLVFGFGVLVTFMLIGFIFYYRHLWYEHKLHEDLLLTIPFDKLKKLSAFHRFYQENYKNY